MKMGEGGEKMENRGDTRGMQHGGVVENRTLKGSVG